MRLSLICLALTLLLPSVGAGQRIKPPAGPPAAVPFDVSTKKLPPNFTGHNIKALYAELSKRQSRAEKGEFETTTEFESRVKREADAPILGGLPVDSTLAFKLMNASGETVYDADAQTLTLALALGKPIKEYESVEYMRELSVEYEIAKDTYQASNAMGAQIDVTRHRGKNYNLAFANFPTFQVKRYLNSITRKLGYTSDIHKIDAIVIEMSMDVPTAKRVRDTLAALAIVRLVKPYTFEGTFYDKPTFNRPEEFFVQSFYLNVEVLELWVYDTATGEIYAKLKSV